MWTIYIWKEAVYFERLKTEFFQKTADLTGFRYEASVERRVCRVSLPLS